MELGGGVRWAFLLTLALCVPASVVLLDRAGALVVLCRAGLLRTTWAEAEVEASRCAEALAWGRAATAQARHLQSDPAVGGPPDGAGGDAAAVAGEAADSAGEGSIDSAPSDAATNPAIAEAPWQGTSLGAKTPPESKGTAQGTAKPSAEAAAQASTSVPDTPPPASLPSTQDAAASSAEEAVQASISAEEAAPPSAQGAAQGVATASPDAAMEAPTRSTATSSAEAATQASTSAPDAPPPVSLPSAQDGAASSAEEAVQASTSAEEAAPLSAQGAAQGATASPDDAMEALTRSTATSSAEAAAQDSTSVPHAPPPPAPPPSAQDAGASSAEAAAQASSFVPPTAPPSTPPSAQDKACSTYASPACPVCAAKTPVVIADADVGTPSEGEGSLEEQSMEYQAVTTGVFLLIALCVGIVVKFVNHLPRMENMPYTVVLFALGLLFARGLEMTRAHGVASPLHDSYDNWMKNPSNTILFGMLPPLLAADAMTMDTGLAKRLAGQCIWLAGPGSAISAILTASALYLFLGDWTFLLCITCGSIHCATDPVAVVGLLKELGCPKKLTLIIQGESLLNDGAAMVLYALSCKMLVEQGSPSAESDHFGLGQIFISLVRSTVVPWAMGMMIGLGTLGLMRLAAKQLGRDATTIQICLTIACAYWSFLIAQGVMEISGVLCTVSASLVLADEMWPIVVHKESMQHNWHLIELIMNTVIFFLAGTVTGNSMTWISGRDYFNVIGVYIIGLVARFIMLLLSRPVLRRMSEDQAPIPMEDTAMMLWGGLRGALGLALAVQLRTDHERLHVSETDAHRLLFYTGGFATLTLLVNAPTSPILVQRLGLASTDFTKTELLMRMYWSLRSFVEDARHNPVVQMACRDELRSVEDVLQHRLQQAERCPPADVQVPTNSYLLASYEEAKNVWATIPSHRLRILGGVESYSFPGDEGEILALISQGSPNTNALRTVSEAFLLLVQSRYWHQLKTNEFPTGPGAAKLLIVSTTVAFDAAAIGLSDLENLFKQLHISNEPGAWASWHPDPWQVVAHRRTRWCPVRFYRRLMLVLVLLNVLITLWHERWKEHDHLGWPWFGTELAVLAALVFDWACDLVRYGKRALAGFWHFIQMMLIGIGIVDVLANAVCDFLPQSCAWWSAWACGPARFMRLLQVLRVVHIWKPFGDKLDKYVGSRGDSQLSRNVMRVVILKAFARAHIDTQKAFLRLFGRSGRLQTYEEARVMLESRTSVHRAIVQASHALSHTHEVIDGLSLSCECMQLSEDLMQLVRTAHECGIITEQDLAIFSHPIENIISWNQEVVETLSTGQHLVSLHDVQKPSTLEVELQAPDSPTPRTQSA